MMDFDTAFTRLLGNEGGFTDNAKDPGNWTGAQIGVGALEGTMWGVTVSVARAAGYKGAMRDLPVSFAKALYKMKYWSPCGADQYDSAFAFQVFDAAVNHGPSTAVILLQRAVGVKADGVLGAQTMAAVRSTLPNKVGIRFIAERLRFWASIPGNTFDDGWMNRAATDLDYLTQDF